VKNFPSLIKRANETFIKVMATSYHNQGKPNTTLLLVGYRKRNDYG
jgi:hypothetical protein